MPKVLLKSDGYYIFGALATLLLIIFVAPIINGFVLSQLWHWFVTPFGADDIRIAHAIGLSMIPAYFLSNTQDKLDRIEKKEVTMMQAAVSFFTQPLSILAVGWLVHRFM